MYAEHAAIAEQAGEIVAPCHFLGAFCLDRIGERRGNGLARTRDEVELPLSVPFFTEMTPAFCHRGANP